MKITFICVGSVKKNFFRDGFEEYFKRIKKYTPLELVEVKEEGASVKMPKEDVLKKEAERILKKTGNADFVVVLADKGKSYTSEGLASFIEDFMAGGRKGLTFIIGGPFGLHNSVNERADMLLSLSAMTLPHDLARLVLAEQVYRAFTIIKGEPYSH